jgi:hypothetical protein
VRVCYEHYRDLSEEERIGFKKIRDDYHNMVIDVLKAGVASGEFKPVDARLTSLAFFGMCTWGYHWYDAHGPLSTREIALRFWTIFMQGISAA